MRNDSAASGWEKRVIEGEEAAFQDKHEVEKARRNVKGDEFDTVTMEMKKRLDRLETQYNKLLLEIEQLRVWLKTAAQHF